MKNLKGMDTLFDSFMEASMCESEHCKIPNKSKMDKKKHVEELSKCMKEKCAKQLSTLTTNFMNHIKEIKKLLENEYNEMKRKNANAKNNKIKMNKIQDALHEISIIENDLKDGQKSEYVSFAKLEQKMNDINKYYKLLS